MKIWGLVFVLCVFATLPCLSGCSSKESIEDTPIQASDEETVESPANDADNP